MGGILAWVTLAVSLSEPQFLHPENTCNAGDGGGGELGGAMDFLEGGAGAGL